MQWSRWKPLKGWRVFGGEIGVVTLGVLIALGAQQIAEEISWHGRVGDARVAFRRELVDHYDNAVERRATEPCVAAQLDALEARVLASGDRLDPAPAFNEGGSHSALRVPSRYYVSAAWQGAIAEGVSSHLPAVERAALAEQYGSSAVAAGLDRDINMAADRLDVMTRPLPLDPGVRLSLLQLIAQARAANALLGLVSGQNVAMIERLGFAPPSAERWEVLTQSGTWAFCRAHRLPLRSFAEARRPLPI